MKIKNLIFNPEDCNCQIHRSFPYSLENLDSYLRECENVITYTYPDDWSEKDNDGTIDVLCNISNELRVYRIYYHIWHEGGWWTKDDEVLVYDYELISAQPIKKAV